MKLKTISIRAAKLAKRAGIASDFRPVDDNGETPARWADVTEYETDEVAAVDDDQDLISAIEEGIKSKKIKTSDKSTKDQLNTKLSTEKKKAKNNREKKPTPDQIIIDDTLKPKGKSPK